MSKQIILQTMPCKRIHNLTFRHFSIRLILSYFAKNEEKLQFQHVQWLGETKTKNKTKKNKNNFSFYMCKSGNHWRNNDLLEEQVISSSYDLEELKQKN